MKRPGIRITDLFSLRRLLFAVASLCLVVITGMLTNWLTGEANLRALPYLVGVWLVLGSLAMFLTLRATSDISVRMGLPTIIRSNEEQTRLARKGVIVFVSLYTPSKGSKAEKLTIEERLAAARAHDYETLDLMNSNLKPSIQAVVTHASAIKVCWLITTTAQQKDLAGSLPYVEMLVAFLKEKHGLGCVIYRGTEYAIMLDDDALVCKRTYDMVRRIYRDARRNFGLSPSEIVADFTSGFRSMTLGMILGTLAYDRDIQFMGTRYDALGRQGKELYPVIFPYTPTLESDV
jgi:hypothetical protein